MSRRDTFSNLLVVALLMAVTATAGVAADFHADRANVQPAPTVSAATGYIPPPIAADHFAAAAATNLRRDKALPASYDCRPQGYVTSVKNQGACGACYAFSSAADVETKLLMSGLGAFDLSENSLKECHYQDSSCFGGNQYLIMNYLTTTGAVLESCDPYVASDVGCTIGCDAQFVVLDWSAISGGTVPAADVIKQYLMDHGPLQTTLYAGDATNPAWSSTFNSYNGSTTLYYTGGQTPNHSVVIVGWDDSLVHTGGTGGWIVKNSWGTSWGGSCGYGTERGYFTIAYGSASIGMWTSYVGEIMPKNPQVAVLRHDEGGFSAGWGGVSTTLWGMARHDVPAATLLHRVEFWTTDAVTDADVYVYDTFNGGVLSGLLASSEDHAISEPGYHHVELDTPLSLDMGQDIYVAVKFTNQSYVYPVAVDMDGPPANGKSWYSVNGASWSSLYSNAADVTIRVRTSPDVVLAVEDDGELDLPDVVGLPERLHIDAAWPNPFNPTTNVRYHLPRDGQVTVEIFNLEGGRVRTLVSGHQDAGEHAVLWDGRDDWGGGVPSGVYFCQVEALDQVRSIKLALLK